MPMFDQRILDIRCEHGIQKAGLRVCLETYRQTDGRNSMLQSNIKRVDKQRFSSKKRYEEEGKKTNKRITEWFSNCYSSIYMYMFLFYNDRCVIVIYRKSISVKTHLRCSVYSYVQLKRWEDQMFCR